jgi:hypothetical protein
VQRVAFVLASAGVAAVLALGVGIFDSNVGIAKARKCPPGSTYERPYGPAACTITKVGSPGNDLLVGSTDPRITNKMYGLGGNDLMYGPGATSDGMVEVVRIYSTVDGRVTGYLVDLAETRYTVGPDPMSSGKALVGVGDKT